MEVKIIAIIMYIVAYVIGMVVGGFLFLGPAVALSKRHASLIARQINQDEERRHKETIIAINDIAKAIRECNEE